MTNLDSVLRSKDITLLTKLHILKAMVFPVVIYRCKRWAIKKGWVPKNWCFQIVVLEKPLESPLYCKEINQSILKEIIPECSLEGLMRKLKLQYFGHLILGKIEGKRRRGQQRMRWLDNFTDLVDMNFCKLQEIVEAGKAWCAAVHGVARSWTWLSDETTI